jgi:uncharacterized membrane protein YkoI
MKTIILLFMPFMLFGSGAKLSYEEHKTLHSFNKRPTIKMKLRSNLHKLHAIDEESAKKIVKKDTGEDVKFLNITHKSRYLFYEVKTKHYYLEVNALDGTIMKKGKKNE